MTCQLACLSSVQCPVSTVHTQPLILSVYISSLLGLQQVILRRSGGHNQRVHKRDRPSVLVSIGVLLPSAVRWLGIPGRDGATTIPVNASSRRRASPARPAAPSTRVRCVYMHAANHPVYILSSMPFHSIADQPSYFLLLLVVVRWFQRAVRRPLAVDVTSKRRRRRRCGGHSGARRAAAPARREQAGRARAAGAQV